MRNKMSNTRRLRVYTRQRQLLVLLQVVGDIMANRDFPKAPEYFFLQV